MRRCGVMCFHGAVAALILLAAGGGASAPAATAAASAAASGSAAALLPGTCRSGDNLQLRGGFEAVPNFKPTNLGQPNAWCGQNIGKLSQSPAQLIFSPQHTRRSRNRKRLMVTVWIVVATLSRSQGEASEISACQGTSCCQSAVQMVHRLHPVRT